MSERSMYLGGEKFAGLPPRVMAVLAGMSLALSGVACSSQEGSDKTEPAVATAAAPEDASPGANLITGDPTTGWDARLRTYPEYEETSESTEEEKKRNMYSSFDVCAPGKDGDNFVVTLASGPNGLGSAAEVDGSDSLDGSSPYYFIDGLGKEVCKDGTPPLTGDPRTGWADSPDGTKMGICLPEVIFPELKDGAEGQANPSGTPGYMVVVPKDPEESYAPGDPGGGKGVINRGDDDCHF